MARVIFNRYLHSEAFRPTLGEAAANALQANHADFAPLDFDGATVFGENFQATRDDGGGFSTMEADELRASFDWHGLLHHTVQIDEMAVQRLNIDPPAKGEAIPDTAAGRCGNAGAAGDAGAVWRTSTRGGRWTCGRR